MQPAHTVALSRDVQITAGPPKSVSYASTSCSARNSGVFLFLSAICTPLEDCGALEGGA